MQLHGAAQARDLEMDAKRKTARLASTRQEALRQVMSGRTTVIVAHRTSTLAIVDNVAFIEAGKLIAFGPHDELLRSVTRYAEGLATTDDSVNV